MRELIREGARGCERVREGARGCERVREGARGCAYYSESGKSNHYGITIIYHTAMNIKLLLST